MPKSLSGSSSSIVASVRAVGIAMAVVTMGVPRRADAADLHVFTVEQRSWPATVAMLETDVHGDGQSVHVYVLDDLSRRVPCSNYTLVLDAVGASAFVIGACDTSTNATAVRLAHRSALFAHDDDIPRPLSAGISAVEVRTGGAAGGAGTSGGSTVQCSIAVRPYITDLEHGTLAYLTPGRYVMRPIGQGIAVDANSNGWTLRRRPGATLSVEYDVFDTQRGEVVVHDRATLTCDSSNVRNETDLTPSHATSAPTVAMNAVVARDCTHRSATPDIEPDRVCAAAPELIAGSTVHGSTVGGEDHFRSTCAQSAAGNDDVYQLRITHASNVSLRLAGNYDGVLSLRSHCGSGAEIVCNDDAPDFRHSSLDVYLEPGVYYVIVDGSGSDCGGRSSGAYELTTAIVPGRRAAAFVQPSPQ